MRLQGQLIALAVVLLAYCACGIDPTGQPTRQPTGQPTAQPTTQPSGQPTNPTGQPSSQPSGQPSIQPSGQPTRQPSGQPSGQPSRQPTGLPTRQPTRQPTGQPSRQPTGQPSRQPTRQPTTGPTKVPKPTLPPTALPTRTPSAVPTQINVGSQSPWPQVVTMSISGLSASDMTDTIIYSLRYAMASVAGTTIDNIDLLSWSAYSAAAAAAAAARATWTSRLQRRRLAGGLSLKFSVIVIASDAQAVKTSVTNALTLYPSEFVTYFTSKATELKGGLADGVVPALVVSSVSVVDISPTSKPTTLIQGEADKFLDKYFGGHSSVLVIALSGAALLLVLVSGCCLWRMGRCCSGKPVAKGEGEGEELGVGSVAAEEAGAGVDGGDVKMVVGSPGQRGRDGEGETETGTGTGMGAGSVAGAGASMFTTPQRAPIKKLALADIRRRPRGESESESEGSARANAGIGEVKSTQAALSAPPMSPAACVGGATDAVVWAFSAPFAVFGIGAVGPGGDQGGAGGGAAQQQHHQGRQQHREGRVSL